MKEVPESFFTTSVQLRHPVAIEPGGGGEASGGSANWDTMGWGHWFLTRWADVPQIDSWKWLDPRRMTHIEERYSHDHTNALQYALLNGVGFNSW